MPAGIGTAVPSTKTSRWACVWVVRNSRSVAVRPAFWVAVTASDGAAQLGCARGAWPHPHRATAVTRLARNAERVRRTVPSYALARGGW